MIERPEISDERIISALRESFGVRVARVEFLPLGWDSASSSWRVEADEAVYFLKIRKGPLNPASVLVPRHLSEQGFQQVIGPVLSTNGAAWTTVDGLNFIVYPFVAGQQVWDVGMSDAHWVELGGLLKRLHSSEVPAALLNQLQRESFIPPRLDWDKALHQRVGLGSYDDPFQEELAAVWLEHYSTISTILERTEELSQEIHETKPRMVPCHGDVHSANILLTDDDRIFLVDWDDTLLAPRERDLLFLPGDVKPAQKDLFFEGYGDRLLDPLAEAYYRYFWCVEDMGGFAETIFTTEQVGALTKADEISWFRKLFAEGGSIDTALRTPIPS